MLLLTLASRITCWRNPEKEPEMVGPCTTIKPRELEAAADAAKSLKIAYGGDESKIQHFHVVRWNKRNETPPRWVEFIDEYRTLVGVEYRRNTKKQRAVLSETITVTRYKEDATEKGAKEVKYSYTLRIGRNDGFDELWTGESIDRLELVPYEIKGSKVPWYFATYFS